MPKINNLPTNLTQEEVDDFNTLCAKQNINAARKIGELIRRFLSDNGVKHRTNHRTSSSKSSDAA